jgi:o-succinylbenzoate synthase
MKITRIEAVPLAMPLRKPMLMAGRLFETTETVIVRLETEGRHAGWGEASVAPFLTGDTTTGILAAVRFLADAVIGIDVRELATISAVLTKGIVANPAAKAAIETAAHDAAGRALGLPVHVLLGGARVREIACLQLIGNGDPARDLAEAEAKAAEGFSALKLKVANGDLEAEAETLVRMRGRFGRKILLAADANAGWTRSEANAFVRLADESMAEFIEQPVHADDVDGMVRVARAGRIPIGADESIHAVRDIRMLIEAGAAAGGSFKIMKLGGLRACLDACRLAGSLGGEVNLSGKVGETSIANAATLALAAVWGAPSWGLSLTNGYLAGDLVADPIVLSGGRVRTRDGAGLGIEVDERMVEKRAKRPESASA